MEPASAIAAALIAGALAVSREVGGQVLKDAYSGLKTILEDSYAFATSKLLDTAAENKAFQNAVESEVAGKPSAVEDERVQAKAKVLLDALSLLSAEDSSRAGIDVGRIKAGRDIIATGGWIRGEDFEAKRDVVLTAAAVRDDRVEKR